MKPSKTRLIAQMLDMMESAIESLDWEVHNDLDPYSLMEEARDYLEDSGWYKEVDGEKLTVGKWKK